MDQQTILKTILLIGHIIGVSIAVGGATMSDVLFLTSIKDKLIDCSELKLLKIASRIVVLGLVITIMSGAGFLLTGSATSGRFWAKMTIVGITAVNGLVMHRKLFPLFEACEKGKTDLFSAEFTQYATLMVTTGCISTISWYSALILGTWRTLTLSYWEIIGIYGGVVFVAVIVVNSAVHKFLENPHVITQYTLRKQRARQ